jgi:cell division protein FtsL
MIIIFLTIVIVVAFYFIRSSSSDYQIRKTLARNPNKLEEAKNPLGFDNHLKNITEKRKNQFIFHDIKESMNTEFL